MNIAYIVICHKDPVLLKRLSETLKYGNDRFFVHVDLKSDIQPFIDTCNKCSNITFTKSRVANYWGGWNSIVATMLALEEARDNGPYDRYILLQGQDYPLHAPQIIHSFLESHLHEEFCKATEISHAEDPGDYMKTCGYYIYDYNKSNIFLRIISNALVFINSKGLRYRSSTFNNNGQSWDIYHGWAQWTLTDCAAEYMLDFYHERSDFNHFIMHRFPPDELYFSTIIYNSQFKENVSDYTLIARDKKKTNLNLTYFEYPNTVVTFTDPLQLQSLLDTGGLFLRKVSSDQSDELLNRIDYHIRNEQKEL